MSCCLAPALNAAGGSVVPPLRYLPSPAGVKLAFAILLMAFAERLLGFRAERNIYGNHGSSAARLVALARHSL
jgi:hypothetical protein